MTHLDYLKQNATSIRELEEGTYTMYKLKEGIAIYNNSTDRYVWYSNPQPWSTT